MEVLKNAVKEAFAQAIFEGKSASEAYRQTHPRSASWSVKTIYSRACEWKKDPEIVARVHELQMAAADEKCMKRGELLSILSDGIRMAAQEGMLDRYAGIVDKLARMQGWYEPEKAEIKVGVLGKQEAERKAAEVIASTLKRHLTE